MAGAELHEQRVTDLKATRTSEQNALAQPKADVTAIRDDALGAHRHERDQDPTIVLSTSSPC